MNSKGRRCALIGASGEAVHSIKVAHEFGYSVVALDGNAAAGGLSFADEAIVVDIRDVQAVERVLKEREVDFVLPAPMGYWLSTVGAINDALQLPGFSRDAVLRCVDKLLFHQVLAEQGLRIGECYTLDSPRVCDCLSSYPVVVKPRFGSGSRGVYLADSKEDLANYVAQLAFEEEYILESAAKGIEYGLDAAVVGDELKLTLLREKVNTPPPARQCVGYYSVPLENACLYNRVAEKMRHVVRALGLRNCILHADLMISEDDVFVIETSPRPSGHRLSSLFTPACTGVDLVREYVSFVQGRDSAFTPSKVETMLIRFFDFELCTVKRVPDCKDLLAFEESLVKYECNILPGQYMNCVRDGSSIMGRGYAMFKGTSRSELDSHVEALMKLFERE